MHFALPFVMAMLGGVPTGTTRLDSAEVYYTSGNYAAVAGILQKREPVRPREKLLLGWSLYRLGNMQGAAASFEAGLTKAPENINLINGHGFALYRLGDNVRAEAEFKRVLAATPDREETVRGLAQVLYTSQRFDECLPVFDRLLRAHPGDADLDRHVVKSVDGMLTAWNAAGRTPAEMVEEGWRLAGQDCSRSSVEIFSWVLALDPFHPGARLGMGTLGPAFGRETEARRCLEELLRENADDFEARLALARLHLDAGRPADAAPQVEKLLAAKHDDPRALALQHEVEERLGSKAP
jgi:tetratricopeptide (TPR) repeat protein